MFRRLAVVCAAILCFAAGPISAASFEVTPMFGYTFNDSIDTDIATLTVQEGTNYGVNIGICFDENVAMEVFWSQKATDVTAGREIPGGPDQVGLTIDQYMVSGLYNFGMKGDKARGFVGVGAGAVSFSPDGGLSADTKFSFTFYGGVKMWPMDKLGLRLQARWTPTYISSDDELWCGHYYYGYYGCYEVASANYVNQFGFEVGLVIPFGGK